MQRCYRLDDCTRIVIILKGPFYICRYLLLNIQVSFSTRQQAIRGSVLFIPDLIPPHKPFQAFQRLYQYSETFQCTFSTPVHIQLLPRPRDVASIDENWTLTERRVRHLEGTVPGRYLLSYHTVNVLCIMAKKFPMTIDNHIDYPCFSLIRQLIVRILVWISLKQLDLLRRLSARTLKPTYVTWKVRAWCWIICQIKETQGQHYSNKH